MRWLTLAVSILFAASSWAGTSVVVGGGGGGGSVSGASANSIIITDSSGNLFGTSCTIPEVSAGVHTSINCPGAPTLPTSLRLHERSDAGTNSVAFTLQAANLVASRTVKADSSGIFSFERHFITAQIPTTATATWIEPTSLGSLVGIHCRLSATQTITATGLVRNTVAASANISSVTSAYASATDATTEILAASSIVLNGGADALGGFATLTLTMPTPSLTDCLIEYRDEE